ncbi:MAG: class I SAM-dependent methyltransferase [Acidobacteria bacterium]|nr:class I SAM-dependent methyltransferase [Acidobacteriota bacterium]
MTGVKLGNRVLVIGCSDGPLIAGLAAKSGLTGRAVAVDESQARTAEAERVAQREGALIETIAAPPSMLPLDDNAFDIVVVRDVLPAIEPEARIRTAQETWRVLRPGGRCLVIESAARGGLGAMFARGGGDARYAAAGGAAHVLEAGGFLAVRTLAESGGLTFVEAVKANRSPRAREMPASVD